MSRYLLLLFLGASFLFACKKDKKEFVFKGVYKMDYGYDIQGNDTFFHSIALLDTYVNFTDSVHVLTSDTIGFPGLYPVISRNYELENETLSIDTSIYSPFEVETYSYGRFVLRSKVLANRYNVFVK